MPLQTPNLDDRSFDQLRQAALDVFRERRPDWSGPSVHDPGTVLLEAFAHLTEVLLYRLNRVPDKNYIEFLKLLGVTRLAPAAAYTTLEFSLEQARAETLTIARGTQVTTGRTSGDEEAPIFHTLEQVQIPAGETTALVKALACELVEAERLGVGSGRPGQRFQLARPPVIAPTGSRLDVVLAVEVAADQETVGAEFLDHAGKAYRVWTEVPSFGEAALTADSDSGRCWYCIDRGSGLVSFAPAVQLRADGDGLEEAASSHAQVPAAGREIRVWYRRGGGPGGNVAQGAIDTMKRPIAGVSVTNTVPSIGGREMESLDNALLRGPRELHSLHRAVTAADFSRIAETTTRGVARARASAPAQDWKHALPGTVQVVLVPEVPSADPTQRNVRRELLEQCSHDAVLSDVHHALERRRPLGTTCIARWAGYKTVAVRSTIVAHESADADAIRERLLDRLYSGLSPLPSSGREGGWHFGRSLRTSQIYEIILAEPGVSYVQDVELQVDLVPQSVQAMAAAADQGHTCYAASEERLFRSINGGTGWECMQRFDGPIQALCAHDETPGMVAVAVRGNDGANSVLHTSADCGETWKRHESVPSVDAMAWTSRKGKPEVLLGTSGGLLRIGLEDDAIPFPIVIDKKDQAARSQAVAAGIDPGGLPFVAAVTGKGLYLSRAGGASESFVNMGLADANIWCLVVRKNGSRRYLWAGSAVPGNQQCTGCQVIELLANGTSTPWAALTKGWVGGSCHALAFSDTHAYAATHHGGVLAMRDLDGAAWSSPTLESGLPRFAREQGDAPLTRLFEPVRALVAFEDGMLLAGGKGVCRATAPGTFEPASKQVFRGAEPVTIPDSWLLCSGEHQIDVVYGDEER